MATWLDPRTTDNDVKLRKGAGAPSSFPAGGSGSAGKACRPPDCRGRHSDSRLSGRDRQVLLFGNGGSAADAQHLAEIVGRFVLEGHVWQ